MAHIATVENVDYKDTSGIATKTVEDISKFSQKKVQSLVHDKFITIPQEAADLVIVTEGILNGKIHFLCSEKHKF